MDSKKCLGCGIIKDVTEFHLHKKSPGGRRSRCKSCRVAECAETYRKKCEAAGNICLTCGTPTSYDRYLCIKHKHCEGNKQWRGGKYRDGNGYVYVSGMHHHPNSARNGSIAEHRLIMTEMLGRPLRQNENVHHINGVRDDNRIENLELWSSSQPSGQRIPDKVAWAEELLRLYAPEKLAKGP